MISRKNQRRLDLVMNLVVAALIINVAIPVRTTVAEGKPLKTVTPTVTVVAPTSVPPLPTIADKPIVKKLTVRSSAYSSTKDQTDSDPFTTASGSKVHEGTIATNGLPFGTKIRIPKYFGDKVFTVEDRMSRKWGTKKIDIWMTTRQQAKQWGVRTITIEIVS